jgi:hypothetical protein
MARKVEVELLDDTDGTVSFALDGVQYEIDLSDRNARRLREAVADFAARGRRIGRVGVVGRRGVPPRRVRTVGSGTRRSGSGPRTKGCRWQTGAEFRRRSSLNSTARPRWL